MFIFKIVVIYNKLVCESESCNALRQEKDVIVFDNSKEEFREKNKEICSLYGFKYLTQNKNVGLSIAYNRVLEHLFNNYDDFYVTWFDDDTKISGDYFVKLKEQIQNNAYDIIFPVVRDSCGILSPSNMYFGFYSKRVKKIQQLKAKRITAINSGMCVSSEVYKSVRYDEDIFLDCVDHYFCQIVRNKGYNIGVMETDLYQNFSEVMHQNVDSMIYRYNIFLDDFLVAFRGPLSKIYLLAKSIRKSLNTKNIVFIKMWCKAVW